MSKVLKSEFVERITQDPALAGLIANEMSKSYHTVLRWAKRSHHNLTLPGVVEIIRKHVGLSEDAELLENRQHERAIAA